MRVSRVILTSFLTLFVFITPVFSEQFAYKFTVGDRYRIISEVNSEVYYDEEFSHNAYSQNIINVEVVGGTPKDALVHARYIITEQSESNEYVNSVQSEQQVTYQWDENGVVTVARDAFLPRVRNVPRFPANRELAVGDTWAFTLEEVFDLRDTFLIETPFKLNAIANYEYTGETMSPYDQQYYPTIKISYPLRANRRVQYGERQVGILGISGETEQILLWDNVRGRPHSYSEMYQFSWEIEDIHIKLVGTAEAYTVELSDTVDQNRKREIEKALQQSRIPSVSIDVDDEGVVLRVEQLRFHPNSTRLLNDEVQRIAGIAEVIGRYCPAQILIVGHTARAGTQEAQQELSELRALTIANLLQQRGINNITIQGVGATQPIASNDSESGRRQNRRVEIKLIGKQHDTNATLGQAGERCRF